MNLYESLSNFKDKTKKTNKPISVKVDQQTKEDFELLMLLNETNANAFLSRNIKRLVCENKKVIEEAKSDLRKRKEQSSIDCKFK